jgi:ribose transport system ATP-binding protein
MEESSKSHIIAAQLTSCPDRRLAIRRCTYSPRAFNLFPERGAELSPGFQPWVRECTALMRVLFGADRKDTGEIVLNGQAIDPYSPREAIEQGLTMIPEDRKAEGLFDLRSVLENIAIVNNETNGLVLNRRQENTIVAGLVERLHIVTAGTRQVVGFLSGGNQQKAILGRWLLSKAQVFIFDEPTKGVDIGAKEQIYDFVVTLAKNGKSILMVSSDMPELISLSNRIAVMRNGKLVAMIPAREATEQGLLDYFLGIYEEGGVPKGRS